MNAVRMVEIVLFIITAKILRSDFFGYVMIIHQYENGLILRGMQNCLLISAVKTKFSLKIVFWRKVALNAASFFQLLMQHLFVIWSRSRASKWNYTFDRVCKEYFFEFAWSIIQQWDCVHCWHPPTSNTRNLNQKHTQEILWLSLVDPNSKKTKHRRPPCKVMVSQNPI